jgi:hypothetical protein
MKSVFWLLVTIAAATYNRLAGNVESHIVLSPLISVGLAFAAGLVIGYLGG